MAPTIIIVPASFTPASMYQVFASELEKIGLKSHIVDLPSVGTRASGKKPGTMLEDAAEIARLVKKAYDDEGADEVVLLANSYGGIPASESMKDVSTVRRKASGKKGVSRIIYLAAIVLPVGVSNDEMRKRPPPPYAKIGEDWIEVDHTQDAPYSFSDMSAEEGLALAAQGQSQSTASFRERATYPGYNDVEVLYVKCTEDQVLPQQGTERILAVIEESSGKAPTIYEFPSGHCPPQSKPAELAQFVKKILA